MRTVWILGDQLHPEMSALQDATPADTRILMIESRRDLRSRPLHARKLVLLLSAMRHFAADLRERGFSVDYHMDAPDSLTALRAHCETYQPSELLVMQPADWDAAQFVSSLHETLGLPVTVAPDTLFLTPLEWFRAWAEERDRPSMEEFYREQRRRLRLLVTEEGHPVGGRWSFESDNRRDAKAAAKESYPPLPAFAPDEITRDVMALVEREFPAAFGEIGAFALPVTRAEARAALDDFIAHRLAGFGAFADAMLAGQRTLYHSLLSPALNLGLLSAGETLERVIGAWERSPRICPVNSLEAFVRQLAGWREFVRGMYWLKMPEYRTANVFAARRPLPQSWWTGETRMRCVAECVRQVRETGYAHHNQRLMVLGNFALLADVDPWQVNEWFRLAFIDAHEWVTLPNVLGVSQFADGGALAATPSISQAQHINRMSDYCSGCAYDPLDRTGPRACPFNYLYWDFLERNEAMLARDPRASMLYANLRQKRPEARAAMRQRAAEFFAGDEMTPNAFLSRAEVEE